LNRCFNFSLLIFFLIAPFAPAAFGQEVFDDPDGQYTVTLPSGWIAVVSQDSLGRKEVNIVFKVRENGSLKIRRVDNVEPSVSVTDFAKRDEEETVRFQPGYDKISHENFLMGGGRTGSLLSYDYKNTAGQPFTGRNYYLRTDEKTIYVLRFTGRRNILGSLRNQTDSIARSFKGK
jgi:hypothetical protein